MHSVHDAHSWPALPLEDWRATYATLHMITQIVGKIRMNLSPRQNHWWNCTLYVTGRGLTTGPMPVVTSGMLELELDFIEHALFARMADGRERAVALSSRPVAEFYAELFDVLDSLDVRPRIDPVPKEVPNPIRHDQDFTHATYDPEYANRHWRVLVQVDRILKRWRAGFTGKASPTHFFWGSFDLACTLFSGRIAPPRTPAPDSINAEAYSHEVISAGFWPGSGNILEPAFYAYASPEPAGLAQTPVSPEGAFYNPPTRGFILRYADVRKLPERARDAAVLSFFDSVYGEAASRGGWDATLMRARELPRRGAA